MILCNLPEEIKFTIIIIHIHTMILILTHKEDVHADIVISKISSLGYNFFRFNIDKESLEKSYLDFNDGVWKIHQNNRQIFHTQIRVIWPRNTFVELTVEESLVQDSEFVIWKNEWNKVLNGFLFSLRDKVWLNFYRDGYAADNKLGLD